MPVSSMRESGRVEASWLGVGGRQGGYAWEQGSEGRGNAEWLRGGNILGRGSSAAKAGQRGCRAHLGNGKGRFRAGFALRASVCVYMFSVLLFFPSH